MGRIISVNTSPGKGEKKTPAAQVSAVAGLGLADDGHAGNRHRQVSLLAMESIAKIRAAGLAVNPGDFAENITTEGIELYTLPLGTLLAIGSTVILKLSQVGKECHSRCAIFYQVGDCVMPREGIFAEVIRGGTIAAGDAIIVTPPAGVNNETS
jgi:MOSC domain-containing protein YiiM